MGFRDWDNVILASAKAAGLTAEQLRAKDYYQVCALAKLTPRKHPAEFEYEPARARAASVMEKEEREQAIETARQRYETQLKLGTGLADTKVNIAQDGSYIISGPTAIAAGEPVVIAAVNLETGEGGFS